VEGYDLPPYGWLFTKPGEILAFSAQMDGRRVDYTRCRDYVYLNAGDRPARVEAVEAQGAVWLKREGKGWRHPTAATSARGSTSRRRVCPRSTRTCA
jgi:hypothetical protein